MRAHTETRRARPVHTALLLAVLTGFVFVIASCVTVNVTNVADGNARVRITLPDTPSGYTRYVRSGESISTFSEYGGTVTVTVIPDEQYRQLLMDLRTKISGRLFDERQSLGQSDIEALRDRLNELDRLLEESGRDGASCSVKTSDYATVNVILGWDNTTSDWDLNCSVINQES